jgi:predicted AlkP superfamily pyrophosphatase or phosphodiesterase
VIVLTGLREDCIFLFFFLFFPFYFSSTEYFLPLDLDKNDDLGNFLASAELAADSKLYTMKTTIPTMSAPNWAAFFTGALPETTGLLGDAWTKEINFDSVFAQAKNFDVTQKKTQFFFSYFARFSQVMRGLTGAKQFAELVKKDLPYLRGFVFSFGET